MVGVEVMDSTPFPHRYPLPVKVVVLGNGTAAFFVNVANIERGYAVFGF